MLEPLEFLIEKDVTYAPVPPKEFVVDYYVTTPKGTKGRFQLRTGLTQIRGARSETAVRSYLKLKHPTCEIDIQRLDFV